LPTNDSVRAGAGFPYGGLGPLKFMTMQSQNVSRLQIRLLNGFWLH
jgi:hypothetical protein